MIENQHFYVSFLFFALNASNSNFGVSKLEMAIQIADKIMVLVLHNNGDWETLHILQTVFWNLPID